MARNDENTLNTNDGSTTLESSDLRNDYEDSKKSGENKFIDRLIGTGLGLAALGICAVGVASYTNSPEYKAAAEASRIERLEEDRVGQNVHFILPKGSTNGCANYDLEGEVAEVCRVYMDGGTRAQINFDGVNFISERREGLYDNLISFNNLASIELSSDETPVKVQREQMSDYAGMQKSYRNLIERIAERKRELIDQEQTRIKSKLAIVQEKVSQIGKENVGEGSE